MLLGDKVSSSQVVVGSVLGKVCGSRLAVCPHVKRVLFSLESFPNVYHSENVCSLDKEHCSSHGRRLKFSPCFGGVRVAWVCPKLVGLPNAEI